MENHNFSVASAEDETKEFVSISGTPIGLRISPETEDSINESIKDLSPL